MYIWKFKNLCIRKQTEASKIIGITPQFLSTICARKIKIRKLLAYGITKFINPNAEIEDFFERVGE